MPQAIDYSYHRHKTITTFTRFTYELGHIVHANEQHMMCASDHGSQDILSIGDVAYKLEITQNFVLIK